LSSAPRGSGSGGSVDGWYSPSLIFEKEEKKKKREKEKKNLTFALLIS
jgi:hypothetical protein